MPVNSLSLINRIFMLLGISIYLLSDFCLYFVHYHERLYVKYTLKKKKRKILLVLTTAPYSFQLQLQLLIHSNFTSKLALAKWGSFFRLMWICIQEESVIFTRNKITNFWSSIALLRKNRKLAVCKTQPDFLKLGESVIEWFCSILIK